MKKYRIAKYPPMYRNEDGAYTKEEWTSYSDIGKVYEEGQFTVKQYLEMEQNYCDVIYAVCLDNAITAVHVEGLENNFTLEELEEMLGAKGLRLFDDDIQFLGGLKNGCEITGESLKKVLPLLLRECFWCKLVDANRDFMIEFGYDFYVYTTCNIVSSQTLRLAEKLGIYVECM